LTRIRRALASFVAASIALLAVSACAGAAPRAITGKLNRTGHSVIAHAPNGRVTVAQTVRGRFRIVPPSKRVTLHLRGPDGRYAGPIVIAGRGTRVIVGVKAGARLGVIRLNGRRGYARVSRRLPRRHVDRQRRARARNGIPVSAGAFGRIRARRARSAAPEDRELDGVPDALDIDDDGDLVLDNLDRRRAARAAQGGEEYFGFFTNLTLDLPTTANANAVTLTPEQMDASLSENGQIYLHVFTPNDSAELDCTGNTDPSSPPPPSGGLRYCSAGGSGRVFEAGVPYAEATPFPECCDSDGDGFGRLIPPPGGAGPAYVLYHGATTRWDGGGPSQFGTGDILHQWVNRGGSESDCPPPPPTTPPSTCDVFSEIVQYIFGTVPALVSFEDGQGGGPVSIDYPVAGHGSPSGPGPGTRDNPLPVRPGPNGVELTLRLWPPQRRPIPNSTCDPAFECVENAWIDIGGLNYMVGIADIGNACPQDAFREAEPKDESLVLPPLSPIALGTHAGPTRGVGAGGFTDTGPDQLASSDNTLAFRLNLTRCLTSNRLSFNEGDTRGIYFGAVAGSGHPDNAQQYVFFRHVAP
jgi:hypothetical protein